jgi:hypothetical protein
VFNKRVAGPHPKEHHFLDAACPGQLGVAFLLGETSPNLDLNKYDFDLYKGFFMAKMAQILQISKKSK